MAKIMEYLMRLKRVSKSCYSNSNSNFNFVRKHFLHSLRHTNQKLPYFNSILLNREINRCCYLKTILSLISGTDDDLSVVDFDHFPCTFRWNFCGHHHNRLCLRDRVTNLFLYNLTTRELSQLPPSILIPPRPRPRPLFFPSLYVYSPIVAFSYDPESNDFKVFRTATFVIDYLLVEQRFEIYDLSSNQWREIPNSLDDIAGPLIDHEMYDVSRGVHYFTGGSTARKSLYVISFSMTTETFSWTPFPMIRPSYRYLSNKMGIWNGSIVMFLLYTTDRTFLEIWLMEQVAGEGGGVSWSKAFTIDDDFVSGINKILQFLNSDQLLMIANDGRLLSYNVKTKELKDLPGLPSTVGGYIF